MIRQKDFITPERQKEINKYLHNQYNQKVKCLKCGKVLLRKELDTFRDCGHIKDNNDLEVLK